MKSCISISADRVDEALDINAMRVGKPIVLSAARIGEPIKLSVSLVCATSNEFYLRVSPDSVIWLDPNSADIFVESNVNWIIE